MFLLRLKEYADARMKLPPPLYSETPVRYIVELDISGRLRYPRPTDTADSSSPRTRRGQRRLAPVVQRTVGIKPLLLADNAEYTFGLPRDETKRARTETAHHAYLELLDRCATGTNEPAVTAVRDFLHDDPVSHLDLPEDFERGDAISFRVWDGTDAVLPIDLPLVQSFWAATNNPELQGARVLQCLICGQERPVLDRLQGKIKGVPGGQTSGTSIISANAQAFESYGLEASLIAPTCADCGERFTKALNELIAGPTTSLRISDAAVCIFWTREQVGFAWNTMLTDPKPQEVRDLLDGLRSGRRRPEVDETAFYAAVLSASGGRTVIRDWIDTTVGEAQKALGRWFTRQAITGPNGEEPRYRGLVALAGATVRELKDIAPPTPRTLLHGALTGNPLPWGLLAQAVRRNRAEQRVTPVRAALIKLVLCSQERTEEEEYMVQLNPDSTDAAYCCGRLLAVLEDVQRAALGKINATIVDRFYGTASSAPLSVFSRLVRGAQPHLAKLRRDRPGAFRALDGRMLDVMSRLEGFPTVLDLHQQGQFALGYYHQRAHDRAEAIAAAERKKAGQATAVESDLADVLAENEEE